jgi:CarD family transcriptional regulator
METSPTRLDYNERPPQFDVGDLVVHPHHGVGRVISSQQRRLTGEERSYLEIDLVDSTLTIMVPCESAIAVGLRPVVGPAQVRQIAAVLEGEPTPLLTGNWSAREKGYREKVKSGDVLELAAVVRDLALRASDHRLATRERELHDKTRRRLASELGCALGLDPEQADSYIDWHVGRHQPNEPRTPQARAG